MYKSVEDCIRIIISTRIICRVSRCFGVTQGSVLGSILYCLYTNSVPNFIQRFGPLFHSYAGDTQRYITIKKQGCFTSKLSDIERCVSNMSKMLIIT